VALHARFAKTYDELVNARFGYEQVKKSVLTIVRLDPDRSEMTDEEQRSLADARVHLDHVRDRMTSLRKALHPTRDDLAFAAVFAACPDTGETIRIERRDLRTLSGAAAPFHCPICSEEIQSSGFAG